MLFYYHYNLIHFYRLKKALPRHGNIPAMSMNYILNMCSFLWMFVLSP